MKFNATYRIVEYVPATDKLSTVEQNIMAYASRGYRVVSTVSLPDRVIWTLEDPPVDTEAT